MTPKYLPVLLGLALAIVPVFSQQDSVAYLTGRLLMEDGSPPSRSFRVELMCQGTVIRQVYPRSDGSFSIDLGTRQVNPTEDSAVGGYVVGGVAGTSQEGTKGNRYGVGTTFSGRLDLKGCHVRMKPETGYLSTEIDLGSRAFLDKPDIGAILVRKVDKELESSVRAGTLSAPPKAVEAYQKSREELGKKKPNLKKVSKELEKAVKEHPVFSEAWNLLGEVQLRQDDLEGARESFQKAIEHDQAFVAPKLNLAQIELEQSHWSEASNLTEAVLKAEPENLRACFLNGIANYYQSKIDASKASLLKIEAAGQLQTYPVASLHLGMIHSKQGDIPAAAAALRAYLEYTPEGQMPKKRRRQIEQQLEQWEKSGLITQPAHKAAQN